MATKTLNYTSEILMCGHKIVTLYEQIITCGHQIAKFNITLELQKKKHYVNKIITLGHEILKL